MKNKFVEACQIGNLNAVNLMLNLIYDSEQPLENADILTTGSNDDLFKHITNKTEETKSIEHSLTEKSFEYIELGCEALVAAATNGHATVVNRLLQVKLIQANSGSEGNAALNHAYSNGHGVIVERLLQEESVKLSLVNQLKFGSEGLEADNLLNSIVKLAYLKGDVHFIKSLIANAILCPVDFKVNIYDHLGITLDSPIPTENQITAFNFISLEVLSDENLIVNGNKYLMQACGMGDLEFFKRLLQISSIRHLLADKENKVFEIACKGMNLKIVECLENLDEIQEGLLLAINKVLDSCDFHLIEVNKNLISKAELTKAKNLTDKPLYRTYPSENKLIKNEEQNKLLYISYGYTEFTAKHLKVYEYLLFKYPNCVSKFSINTLIQCSLRRNLFGITQFLMKLPSSVIKDYYSEYEPLYLKFENIQIDYRNHDEFKILLALSLIEDNQFCKRIGQPLQEYTWQSIFEILVEYYRKLNSCTEITPILHYLIEKNKSQELHNAFACLNVFYSKTKSVEILESNNKVITLCPNLLLFFQMPYMQKIISRFLASIPSNKRPNVANTFGFAIYKEPVCLFGYTLYNNDKLINIENFNNDTQEECVSRHNYERVKQY